MTGNVIQFPRPEIEVDVERLRNILGGTKPPSDEDWKKRGPTIRLSWITILKPETEIQRIVQEFAADSPEVLEDILVSMRSMADYLMLLSQCHAVAYKRLLAHGAPEPPIDDSVPGVAL